MSELTHTDAAQVHLADSKRADDLLRASERRYRRLFESAKDGILILDADDGKIVDVNPFMTELTGYSHEDFLGKQLWEIGPFADIAASKASFAELMANEYVRYDDLPLKTADGSQIAVEFVSNLYSVESENVIQCNIRDITARKRAEKRAAERIRYLADYPENSPNPVFEVDHACTITYANSAARKLLPTLENAGRAHPLLRDFETIEAACSASSAVVVRECTEGDHWFEARYSRFEPLGRIRVYCLDITDRKKVEMDLRLKDAAIETSVAGISIADLQGKLLYVNRAFATMLGCETSELLGRTVTEIWPQQSEEILDTLARDGFWTGEKSLQRKDGTRLVVYVASNMIADANGKPIAAMGSMLDLTARKELEEQLQASQKLEAIGSLAGGVAHDFNNLLSVILSYTAFAMDEVPDGDPVKDDLLEVKNAGERAAVLTRQLLAFSRKQLLQPVVLDLNEIAAGLEKMLRRILGEDIELVQMLAPDLGLTVADPGQLEQVLMNLVVNARDAMPEGGKLTIATSNAEIDEGAVARHAAVKPGSYVRLVVSDTGAGMDEHTRAHIFEPFFTTKAEDQGTGLGLSMAYGIVKQSGGTIRVHSEPGYGTTFEIYLPRELSATTAAAVESSTTPRPSTGSETVLVVEDEEALRKIALRTLRAAGYEVLSAANGEEALLTSAQHGGDIHLLLTDVVMPRMGGRVLAQNLSKARPAIKVLYMSGYSDDTIIRHGVIEAGTPLIAKPFTAADLARKVRDVLDAGPLK